MDGWCPGALAVTWKLVELLLNFREYVPAVLVVVEMVSPLLVVVTVTPGNGFPSEHFSTLPLILTSCRVSSVSRTGVSDMVMFSSAVAADTVPMHIKMNASANVSFISFFVIVFTSFYSF